MTTKSESESSPIFIPERLNTRAQLHDLLALRRSPRAFSDRAIEPSKLLSLFESARWSPSSANEQPWNFIAATKDDRRAYNMIAESLLQGNRRWALRAPLLVVGIVQSTYLKSGSRYRHAWYDLGQSIAHMTVQASSVGLSVHQMGGFDAGQLRKGFSIPDSHDIVIVLAIGYAGRPEILADDLRDREQEPRMRKPLEAFVFTEEWGHPSHHVAAQQFSIDSQPSSN